MIFFLVALIFNTALFFCWFSKKYIFFFYFFTSCFKQYLVSKFRLQLKCFTCIHNNRFTTIIARFIKAKMFRKSMSYIVSHSAANRCRCSWRSRHRYCTTICNNKNLRSKLSISMVISYTTTISYSNKYNFICCFQRGAN